MALPFALTPTLTSSWSPSIIQCLPSIQTAQHNAGGIEKINNLFTAVTKEIGKNNAMRFSSRAKEQIWIMILLHEMLPSTQLHTLEPNQYYKKTTTKEALPLEKRFAISFLTDFQKNLYGVTRIYLGFDSLKKGTRHKVIRLALCIQDLSLSVLYYPQKAYLKEAAIGIRNEVKIHSLLQNSPAIMKFSHASEKAALRPQFMSPYAREGTFGKLMDMIELDRFYLNPLAISLQESYFKILHDILIGISQMHNQGIIHHDIKPDNIFIMGERAYISDFEYATTIQQAKETSELDSLCGTIEYMAPERILAYFYRRNSSCFNFLIHEASGHRKALEQHRKQIADNHLLYISSPASDIWSLGCMIYEFLYDDYFPFIDRDRLEVNASAYFFLDQKIFAKKAFNRERFVGSPFCLSLHQLAEFILILDPHNRPNIDKVQAKFKEVYLIFRTQLKSRHKT